MTDLAVPLGALPHIGRFDLGEFDIAPSNGTGWPVIHPAAFHGLAGDFVDMVAEHSEADRVALLLTYLVVAGNALGNGPRAMVGGSQHPARFFCVLVGETSRGRKGTSLAEVMRVFDATDLTWSRTCKVSGLSSGEGLLMAVRDGDGEEDKGVIDKRRLAVEPEFGRVLRVAEREGNSLSGYLREAWDVGEHGRIGTLTKTPIVTTGPHISALGHTTVEELRRGLTDVQVANGLANRFMFALVKRSQLLPEGGNLDDDTVVAHAHRLKAVLDKVRAWKVVRRSPDATALWAEMYREMAEDPGGMLGAVTARAEAQCLRLSLIYALLDSSRSVEVHHLRAAYAAWRYCHASAGFIFGDRTGDPTIDKLLAELRQVWPEGLSFTQQSALFGRHVSKARLDAARDFLVRAGLAETGTIETDGRSTTVLVLTSDPAKKAKDAK